MNTADFEDLVTECYGTITIAGITFDAGAILRMMDPVAFRDFQAETEADMEDDDTVA